MPRESGRKQGDRAWTIRQALFDKLGRLCAVCGIDEVLAFDEGRPLEFDHPNGRAWDYTLNRAQRALRLIADEKAGNLRVLCRSCNGSDGAKKRWSH
jgi:hypothetical protein